ncbi:hypothetical protein OS493_036803 [Desmophyllum pertusum]|uniref:Uncharacterized protein n=1 Tax=Desmophyllum pertusum TaxID=174260 RepID=A0A9X0D6F9_9CNID|nr:hypothetical protein OS493_036803 [Desmophyllum pertusum]
MIMHPIHYARTREHPGEGNEWRPRSVGLPRKVRKSVGRMGVCEDITGLFTTEDDDITCLVTIVAPPGFGKTAVATNIGHMMLDQGKDVLYFSLRKYVVTYSCSETHGAGSTRHSSGGESNRATDKIFNFPSAPDSAYFGQCRRPANWG